MSRQLVAAMVSIGVLSPTWAGASISFPSTPLAVTSSLPPNVLLALSVEYPTMGTAYNGISKGLKNSPVDATQIDLYFDPAIEYVGYWRSDRCYNYDDATGYFVEAAVTANMSCSGAGTSARWSGNFINWALTSAIDVFRSTMSGGYRVVDTATLTVLQRAQLSSSIRGGNTMPVKEVGTTYSTLSTSGKNVDPRLFTPFNVDRLRVTPTDTQFFVDGWNAANVKQALNGAALPSQNFFPRVKACDSSLGAVANSCTAYGTSLKPTGEIQNRADTIRFGAFGYLIDNTMTRDGGVLRASMRNVGRTKVVNGVSGANAQAEWNDDGTFIVNPDAAAEGNSGVSNYLNKFGLTSGYKGFDPVSELYSESLRYLMGKAPRASSTSGITDAMKDGFPVATAWVDPIPATATCQKNYILVIGDSNTHCDGRVSGGQENKSADCGANNYAAETSNGLTMNASTWTDYIGVREGRGTSLSTTQTGSSNRGTFFMAGLAYFAHVNNIRPDIPNSDIRVKTFVIDVDEAGGPAYNQRNYWYAAKYGGFDDVPTDADKANTTYRAVPDAGEWETASTIPGNTTQPKTFFLASNGKVLQSSLKAAFASIAAEGAGSPKLAASAGRFTSSAEGVFTTTMDTISWTGNLIRKNVTYSGSSITVSPTAAWTASAILTGTKAPVVAANPAPGSRNIVTYNPVAKSGVDLTWSALPASFQAALKLPYSGQTVVQTDTEGQRRLAWLRGVRTEETVATNPLRSRISLLGDPGSGSPVYVGAPGSDRYPDSDYYVWSSAAARKDRSKMVYLGTSEGMLHGFDASTGVEKLAYVPSRLFAKFASSADSTYTRKPMVDVSPSVTDVKFGAVTGTDWRSLLVGTLGAGGKGVYALDVTDPGAFGSSSVAWEFTENDDADVGQITSAPLVTRLSDGRFAVMFGSGYNNSVPATTGEAASATGTGYLFVLLADKGGGTSWLSGTNYKKIALGTAGTVAAPAGVANPNASRDAAGFASSVYLGDLDGQLWRVDVPPKVGSAVSMSSWSDAAKVFTASNGSAQPITSAPALVFHPEGGVVALFGTGKMLETADRSGTLATTNSFYGVWDKNLAGANGAPNLTRTNLLQQTLTTNTATGRRTVSGSVPDWSTKRGWFVDLATSGSNNGERMIYRPNVDLGSVDFTTQLGVTACSSGSGYFMSLDPVTGLMTAPTIDSNNDGSLTLADKAAGYATTAAPGEVSIFRLALPSSPYGKISYVRTFGSTLVNPVGGQGVSGADGTGGVLSTAASDFGRGNFRKITEIKR